MLCAGLLFTALALGAAGLSLPSLSVSLAGLFGLFVATGATGGASSSSLLSSSESGGTHVERGGDELVSWYVGDARMRNVPAATFFLTSDTDRLIATRMASSSLLVPLPPPRLGSSSLSVADASDSERAHASSPDSQPQADGV